MNIVLTCLAAGSILLALDMPWFATAVNSNDGYQGSIELMGEGMRRWFTDAGATTTGTDSIGSLGTALLGVAAATALLALAMLLPALRSTSRHLLKMLPLAAPVIALAAILSESGAAGVEPRYGAFAALALTVLLASAAQQAAEMREKKVAPKPYSPGARAR
jgi:hypothetical protein